MTASITTLHDVHGTLMTIPEAAAMKGLTVATLDGRMRRNKKANLGDLLYPADEARTNRAKTVTARYEYNGEDLTCYRLANIAKTDIDIMRLRLSRMTVEDAMDMTIPTPRKTKPTYNKQVEIPKADPDLELKNRIKSYLRMKLLPVEMLRLERKRYI